MTALNVLVVGTWHLGSVIGACLADVGNHVSLWDQSPHVAGRWREGKAPIHEPGLDDLVTKHWNKNLSWAQDFKKISNQAHWIVIAYDTPINDKDEIILDAVEEGLKQILDSGFSNTANFFFTSQLPVGTSRRFRNQLAKKNPQWNGSVVYQPENLRLGEAIKSFQAPDRMVLGVETLDEPKKNQIVESFVTLLQNRKTPLNVMSLESSEMVKHALNSFLATCVVFANEISEICEKTGANAWDVVTSLKQDSRVGPKAFLRPGLGFAGGTLARDVKTLSTLSTKKGQSNFFSDLYHINTLRNDWVIDRLREDLGSLEGKNIVLLGVTYKPGTSTVRRSPALDIAQLLKTAGAHCVAVDPMADLDELTEIERKNLPFKILKNHEEALSKSDGAVVVTEWPEFKEWNWQSLKNSMNHALIVDSKNHLAEKIRGLGFKYIVPGQPQPAQKKN